ncbi:hypothetical protein C4D60_Mb05t17930 [Musa balbisiana]|uniref:Uncharacterized protein n=1 Tax=Musa balbisiana TaxID=52838 RepID=A0A4S8JWY5_MUSBA|nr:hypothetical protein C4D60_Mb05t17930 [Musa balbisiana]
MKGECLVVKGVEEVENTKANSKYRDKTGGHEPEKAAAWKNRERKKEEKKKEEKKKKKKFGALRHLHYVVPHGVMHRARDALPAPYDFTQTWVDGAPRHGRLMFGVGFGFYESSSDMMYVYGLHRVYEIVDFRSEILT